MAKTRPSQAYIVMGKRLQHIRKSQMKSLNQAAREAGIKPKALLKIEQGKAIFRILTFTKLCRAYNISMDAILADIDR